MFFGLPLPTITCSLFVANSTGLPRVAPGSVIFCMLASSADANTSAVAPWLIGVGRVDDAAKLNFTVAPGLAVWNALPSSVNAPVSDVAAKTLIVPVARGAVVLGAPGVVMVVVVWVGKTGVGRKMPLDEAVV